LAQLYGCQIVFLLMLLNHILLGLAWILYCVLHSLLASIRFKNAIQHKTGRWFRYYRLYYTLFAFLSLAAVIFFQLSIQTVRVYTTTLATLVAGGLVALAGLSIMLVCIKKYFLSLSGLKSLYQEEPSAELMIAGIHRYMRHPLYTGTFLFIWGLWITFPSLGLLIADAVITLYTLYAIRLEEHKLVAEFGEKYRDYQTKVPKLIPKFSIGRLG
jgi:protein-S-isoprenylcysteine O-methyltransferase Ste14